jgi:hypothetical protein
MLVERCRGLCCGILNVCGVDMPAAVYKSPSGHTVSLGRARFESLLRNALPSVVDAAGDIFDTCLHALRAANFTPPSVIFAEGVAPADMFSAMYDKVGLSLAPSVLSVVFRTVAAALLGGAAALLVAAALEISLDIACVMVALIWWVGGVQKLFSQLKEIFQEQIVSPMSASGNEAR